MRRLRSLVLVTIAVLALPASTLAFLLQYTLEGSEGEFALNIEENPMWTLTVGEDVYASAALDSAKFSGELDVSFSDSTNITRNDQPVEATLKGSLKGGCDAEGKGKVTLKDATNGVTITIDSREAVSQGCSGNV
jgi:hypothetical protein